MTIPKLEDLNSSTCTERYMKAHYPDFYDFIMSSYPGSLSWSEKLYWYYHKLVDWPVCRSCGGRTKFVNFKVGYREFCGYSCMNRSVQGRREETFLKRYGVKNPMQSLTVKDKQIHTILEKYGTTNVFGNKDIQRKIHVTNLVKYGTKYPMQSGGVVSKMLKTRNNITMAKDPSILDISTLNETPMCTVRCPHPNTCTKCQDKTFEIPANVLYDRRRLGSEQCTRRAPVGVCTRGTAVEMFVRTVLDEYGVEYECNNRAVLGTGKELDIYIPDRKIAVECNGVYWHSSDFRPGRYHVDKYQECLGRGVQLLTLWEDWIVRKPDIVRSLVLSKLGLIKNKIGARECDVREVGVKDCNRFLERNHIQGKTPTKVRIGLYKDDVLVSVMCFGPRQTMDSKKEGEWDLTRFCNLLNLNVIGAASRMLKYFIVHYRPDVIYSFSSNDISTGKLYETLGFKKSGGMNQSYWYVDSRTMKRYHRSSFSKDSIVRKGWKKDKIGWTEREVMKERGYFQIYDSGQTKWEYRILVSNKKR